MEWIEVLALAALLTGLVLVFPMSGKVMRRFYRPLERLLLRDDPNCIVEQPTATTIVYRMESEHGTTTFRLEQTLLFLEVTWTNESPVTGPRHRSWRFFKLGSQRRMMDRIYDDLLDEHRRMMRS